MCVCVYILLALLHHYRNLWESKLIKHTSFCKLASIDIICLPSMYLLFWSYKMVRQEIRFSWQITPEREWIRVTWYINQHDVGNLSIHYHVPLACVSVVCVHPSLLTVTRGFQMLCEIRKTGVYLGISELEGSLGIMPYYFQLW